MTPNRSFDRTPLNSQAGVIVMNSVAQVLRSVASIAAGYATIVVAALIFQDALFGGISLPDSPLPEIAIGGGFTVIGAIAGGYLLALVSRRRPMLHAAVLAAWLIFEGAYLFVAGITANPLWFDLASSSSLAVGVILGSYAFVYRARSANACS